jgi:hypothetical protein
MDTRDQKKKKESGHHTTATTTHPLSPWPCVWRGVLPPGLMGAYALCVSASHPSVCVVGGGTGCLCVLALGDTHTQTQIQTQTYASPREPPCQCVSVQVHSGKINSLQILSCAGEGDSCVVLSASADRTVQVSRVTLPTHTHTHTRTHDEAEEKCGQPRSKARTDVDAGGITPLCVLRGHKANVCCVVGWVHACSGAEIMVQIASGGWSRRCMQWSVALARCVCVCVLVCADYTHALILLRVHSHTHPPSLTHAHAHTYPLSHVHTGTTPSAWSWAPHAPASSSRTASHRCNSSPLTHALSLSHTHTHHRPSTPHFSLPIFTGACSYTRTHTHTY